MKGILSKLFFVTAAFCIALAGCASIVTVDKDTDKADAALPRGRYYLPRTIFNLKVAVDATTKAPSIALSKAVETDPKTPLTFRFDLSGFADDTLEVDTDENGLLTAVNSDTSDRTGDIAIKIADLIFTSATGGATAPDGRSLQTDPLTTAYSFAASYDPFDPAQIADVKKALAAANFCVLVGLEAAADASKACVAVPAPPRDMSAQVVYASEFPGIYYRKTIATPVKIFRRSDAKSAWQLLFTGTEQLFDQSDLYRIQINRTAFVDKKYTISFANGSLQKVLVSKPSEVLAGVQIPVTIAKIIFAIPAAGFAQSKALVGAQTDLATAQAGYINAATALQPLQASAAAAGIAVPGGNRSLDLGPTVVTDAALAECQTRYASMTVDQCRALLSR